MKHCRVLVSSTTVSPRRGVREGDELQPTDRHTKQGSPLMWNVTNLGGSGLLHIQYKWWCVWILLLSKAAVVSQVFQIYRIVRFCRAWQSAPLAYCSGSRCIYTQKSQHMKRIMLISWKQWVSRYAVYYMVSLHSTLIVEILNAEKVDRDKGLSNWYGAKSL